MDVSLYKRNTVSEVDEVRKLVKKEGRTARNLLTFHVPLNEKQEDDKLKRSWLFSPRQPMVRSATLDKSFSAKIRVRSASAGRNPKADLHARHWAFLFENLHRAVDEIYNTCETDESIIECKEVIMILENFTKEFSSLIDWLNLKKEFENTSVFTRPPYLAWEIRKSSPIKRRPSNVICRNGSKSKIARVLNFEERQIAILTTSTIAVQTESDQISRAVTCTSKKPELSVGNVSVYSKEHSTVSIMKTPMKMDKNIDRSRKGMTTSYTESTSKQTKFVTSKNHIPSAITTVKKPRVNNVEPKSTPSTLNRCNLSASAIKQPSNTLTASVNESVVPTQSAKQSNSNSKTTRIGKEKGSVASSELEMANNKSWADKVRGTTTDDLVKGDDTDGWETVHRSKFRNRNSPPKKPGMCIQMYEKSKTKDRAGSVPLENFRNKRGNAPNGLFSRTLRKYDPQTVRSLPSLHLFKEKEYDTVLPDSSLPDTCDMKSKIVNHQTTIEKLDVEKNDIIEKEPDKVIKDEIGSKDQFVEKSKQCDQASKEVAVPQTEKENEVEKYSLTNLCNSDHDEGRDIKSDEDDGTPLDDALESAIQEEESLNKQIEEAKKSDPDLEPDNFDGTEESSVATSQEDAAVQCMDWHILHQQTEERLGQQLMTMSWGDRMDEIEADLRLPGHALHMHEKLSSPSRKRPLTESIRKHEEKQAKAQHKRERLLEEKAQKLRDLSKKVEEVRVWKEELLLKRRTMMDHKLQKAEEKRRLQLQMIRKKAHDEEEKVNEIAFINSLEAQNKRHDVLSRIQGHEARLQDIQGERQRKQEEKAAKEAAAEERRRALEAERQARLIEIQEKRKRKQFKIEQQQQEKEKERLEQAREKARDREERLSALYAAQQATVEELQKKIQQKQEDSARRHEENIEHIRQRALELSILRFSSVTDDAPGSIPYDTKKICSICNVLIVSEVYLLSHLRGKKHQQAVQELHEGKEPSREELERYNLKHIVNAPAEKIDSQAAIVKERQRTLKKRCRKLRQRMTTRGAEFEESLMNDSQEFLLTSKSKLVKLLKGLGKYLQRPGSLSTNVVTTMERTLGEVGRLLEKKDEKDIFRLAHGFQTMGQVWEAMTRPCSVPVMTRPLLAVCNVLQAACELQEENCAFMVGSNRIGMLLDTTVMRLNALVPDKDTGSPLPVDPVAATAMHVLATVLEGLARPPVQEKTPREEEAWQVRIHDLLSYVVSVGVVDKMSRYFHLVHGPLPHDASSLSIFLLRCMDFLTALTKLHLYRSGTIDPFAPVKTDEEELASALRATGLVGAVSLLYGILLHGGAPSRSGPKPPQLPPTTLALALCGLRMLNHVALIHLDVFQGVLGDDALSLEFRHIASYLLWYCSQWREEAALLHEVILTVGYFTVLNEDHQAIIHSGHTPTLLQQLCTLPFPYFSDRLLVQVLFPTLIASCHLNAHNIRVLQQEMSAHLLQTFLQDSMSHEDPPIEAGVDGDWRWRLSVRFPRHRWSEANAFFATPPV